MNSDFIKIIPIETLLIIFIYLICKLLLIFNSEKYRDKVFNSTKKCNKSETKHVDKTDLDK